MHRNLDNADPSKWGNPADAPLTGPTLPATINIEADSPAPAVWKTHMNCPTLVLVAVRAEQPYIEGAPPIDNALNAVLRIAYIAAKNHDAAPSNTWQPRDFAAEPDIIPDDDIKTASALLVLSPETVNDLERIIDAYRITNLLKRDGIDLAAMSDDTDLPDDQI